MKPEEPVDETESKVVKPSGEADTAAKEKTEEPKEAETVEEPNDDGLGYAGLVAPMDDDEYDDIVMSRQGDEGPDLSPRRGLI